MAPPSRAHRLKGLIKPWSYLVKVSLIDVHAADIQPHSKAIVEPEQLTEALPLNLWIVRAEVREAHRWSSRPLTA